MVFLKIFLLLSLALLPGYGCRFEPVTAGCGYQPCTQTIECLGGFVCLRDRCVPDCLETSQVLWVKPAQDDNARVLCPGDCQLVRALDRAPSRLQAILSPGQFLELGAPMHMEDPGCGRLLFRLSLLAEEMPDLAQGLDLNVVIRSSEATGLVPDEEGGRIALEKVDGNESSGSLERLFAEHRHYYLVDADVFSWPVQLRLVPADGDTVVSIWVRNFAVDCCR